MVRKKVLIVEDDPFLRNLLGDVLGRDYEMTQACDGNEGLLAAMAVRPDAVVTDLMMPVSGLVLIKGLSEDPSTRTIPVLVMTARYLDESARKFLANEGNVRNYFSKGADLQTLREKVSGLFEGRSAGEIKP